MPLYARAGVPEVWLVDLSADGIEMYRQPAAGQYASAHAASRDDRLTPLHLPHVTLTADEILG